MLVTEANLQSPVSFCFHRKRNHSGENVASGLVCNQMSKSGGTANSKSGAAATHEVLDYIARRNLGTQLTSPNIPEEGSQANKRSVFD